MQQGPATMQQVSMASLGASPRVSTGRASIIAPNPEMPLTKPPMNQPRNTNKAVNMFASAMSLSRPL